MLSTPQLRAGGLALSKAEDPLHARSKKGRVELNDGDVRVFFRKTPQKPQPNKTSFSAPELKTRYT